MPSLRLYFRNSGIPMPERSAVQEKSDEPTLLHHQAPSYQRTACGWVMTAKKEETRLRRLATLVEDSAQGRRMGIMGGSGNGPRRPKWLLSTLPRDCSPLRERCYCSPHGCYSLLYGCYRLLEDCYPLLEGCYPLRRDCYLFRKRCYPLLKDCYAFLLCCYRSRDSCYSGSKSKVMPNRRLELSLLS
jgi:hypothetical protein